MQKLSDEIGEKKFYKNKIKISQEFLQYLENFDDNLSVTKNQDILKILREAKRNKKISYDDNFKERFKRFFVSLMR